MEWMDRRIASGVASFCFYIVAIPLGLNLMVDPALDARVGWSIVTVAGIAGTVFGAYAAFGAQPFAWVVNARRRSTKWISLSEAVRYIGERSVWAKGCPVSMKEWNRMLPRAIVDAAGTGDLAATGRKPRNQSYDLTQAFGRVPIGKEFWETAWFQAIPNIMERDGDTRNVIYKQEDGLQAAYIDVEVRAADVRRIWPRLLPWDKFESPITRSREGRPLPGEHD
jgi:hypothetical protein